MIFGYLIECNMKNIFIEISYTKHSGETSLRLFPEKLKQCISESIVESSIQFLSVCQVEGYRNRLKLSCRPLAFTSY